MQTLYVQRRAAIHARRWLSLRMSQAAATEASVSQVSLSQGVSPDLSRRVSGRRAPTPQASRLNTPGTSTDQPLQPTGSGTGSATNVTSTLEA
eukprot:1923894-Pleurochrysis_carterae.AAC.2